MRSLGETTCFNHLFGIYVSQLIWVNACIARVFAIWL